MKLFHYLLPAALLLAGCSTDLTDISDVQPTVPGVKDNAAAYNPELFAQPDGSPRANSTSEARGFGDLISKMDPKQATTLGQLVITPEQYDEIKTFVDENLADSTSQYQTYRNIFDWIYKEMTYANDGQAYLDPYDVFTYKRCVCQGYANLLRTMCHTQGIPAFNSNGDLVPLGGHAWDYVYADSVWYVSDPTNYMQFKMTDYTSYYKKLVPYAADLTLYSNDELDGNYRYGHFNVDKVKSCPNSYFVVPFSLGGFRLTCFCISAPLPKNVTQIYIGRNIETFGEYPTEMNRYMPNVEEIFVDPKNTKLSTFGGAVYQGKVSKICAPYYVPVSTRKLTLKALKTVEKNTITDLEKLEELHFSEGTKTIESYAVKSCPNLKRVYIPETVQNIATDAFYRCGDNVEIIRVPTGIHEVTK